MKTVLSILLGIVTSLFIWGHSNAEDGTIIWHQADFPPAFILNGEDAGKGYCNKMQRDVATYLKDYEHRYVESNYKRISESLKADDNACCASIYKTPEREKYAAYSDPLFIGFSNGVIIPEERVFLYNRYITPERMIDLKALMAGEAAVKIGIVSGRNYGPIESVITPFKGTERIYERASTDSKGLVKMLMSNRIDILLALPLEIAYTAEQLGIGKETIRFFPLKDGELYTVSYMACSGNDWGRKVIEKVNAAIHQNRPVFAKYYRERLDGPSAAAYDALVEKVLKIKPAE